VTPDLAYLVAQVREAIATGGPQAVGLIQHVEAQVRLYGIVQIVVGCAGLAALIFCARRSFPAVAAWMESARDDDGSRAVALVIALTCGIIGATMCFSIILDGIDAATMPLVWLFRELR
jgi:hypothetical protein